jgi:hypothetical protein
MVRFSISSVLVAIAVIGAGTAIVQHLDVVVATYYVLLVLVGYTNALLPLRVRWSLLAMSTIFCGAAYPMIVPAPGVLVPIIDLPALSALCIPIYVFAELPLHLAGNLIGPQFEDLIMFRDPFTVRPIVVCAFWASIAIVLATSLLVTMTHRTLMRWRQPVVAVSNASEPVSI